MHTYIKNSLILTLLLLVFVAFSVPDQPDSEQGKQSLSTPPDGEILTLQAALENRYFMYREGQDIFLYINVVAGKDTRQKGRTPLNLSLVIDRSGSMSSENKLDFVKKACEIVIDNLTPMDNLSIVAYDDKIDILQISEALEHKELLKEKVRQLEPGMTTNLGGGMLEGFAQAHSTYKEKMVNRVLLLSDGLANAGVTSIAELQEIVKSKYEKTGVAISTFGVGLDYNEDLMTSLAEYGRGNYYFIDAADNIPEIFQKELQGLLSVVAQNARLKVKFDASHFELKRVYGYEHEAQSGELDIDFNDVFSEEQKSVLIHWVAKDEFDSDLSFEVSLSYDDVVNSYERKDLLVSLDLNPTLNQELFDSGYDEEVVRNRILFQANDILERAMKQVDEGHYEEAKKLVEKNKRFMEGEFEHIEADSALLGQFQNNQAYGAEIDDIEEKSAAEVQMMQKASKNSNYQIRKKKKR